MMDELDLILSGLSENIYCGKLLNLVSYENYNDMKQIGDINNLPEELSNPFNSDCITNVTIRTFKRTWDSNWCTYGTVEFRKGNTTGEQEFNGTDLVDVLRKIYIFVNHL